MDNSFIRIGKILRPVGLKGQVLIRVYSQMDSILIPGSFFVKSPSGRYEEFFLSGFRQKGQKEAVCDIRQVDSRDKAEKISKSEIFQKVSRLPLPEEDEFYWFELRGLKVVTGRGEPLGRVHSIIETGAGDVLVVRDENMEILVPMVDGVVRKVDLEAGECIVELPPGLLEATGSRLKAGD